MNEEEIKCAGIDYGRRRIGVAVSDGLGITAQQLCQLEVSSMDDAAVQLSELLKEKDIETVVYGMPMNMDGSVGEMGNEIKKFAARVQDLYDIPFEFFDERLTSEQAKAILSTQNGSWKKKKKKIDVVSAQIMLQTYMDLRARRRGINA